MVRQESIFLILFVGLLVQINADQNHSRIKFIQNGVSYTFWKNWNPTSLNTSSNCFKDILAVKNAAKQGEIWAYKMINSASAPLNGIFEGTMMHFGKFDECLAIYYEKGQGQYVYFQLRPDWVVLKQIPLAMDQYLKKLFSDPMFILRTGICMPSSCSHSETQTIFKEFFANYGWIMIKPPSIQIHNSLVQEIEHWPMMAKFSGAFVSGLIGVVIATSFLVSHFKSNEYVNCLSIKSNFNKLKDYPQTTNKPYINWIDGVRFWNQFHLILNHILAYSMALSIYTSYDPLDKLIILSRKASLQFLFSETMFQFLMVLPALTTSFKLINEFNHKHPINNALFNIFERFLSQIPVMWMLVSLNMFVPKLFSGPMSLTINDHINRACTKNGWKALLLISNFDFVYDMCVPHAWTISIEFQMFAIASFLALLYRFNSAIGFITNLLIIGLGLSIQARNMITYNLGPMNFANFYEPTMIVKNVNYNHFGFSMRCSEYFVIVLAVFCHFKKWIPTFTNFTKNMINLFCLIYYIASQFAPLAFTKFNLPETRLNVILFLICYRMVIPLCFSWTVIGYGDFLMDSEQLKQVWIFNFIFRLTRVDRAKKFLVVNSKHNKNANQNNKFKLTDWIMLIGSRMVRSLYYFHPVVLVCLLCELQTPFKISAYPMWSIVLTQFASIWMFSLIMHLLLEMPIINLSSLLIKKYVSTYRICQKTIDHKQKLN